MCLRIIAIFVRFVTSQFFFHSGKCNKWFSEHTRRGIKCRNYGFLRETETPTLYSTRIAVIVAEKRENLMVWSRHICSIPNEVGASIQPAIARILQLRAFYFHRAT